MTIKKSKGFLYILTVMIIISLISMVLLITNTPSKIQDNKCEFLGKNYVNELEFLLTNDYNEEIINNFNTNFKNYINANNFNVEMCNIIDDQENYVYISNFTGNDCNLFFNDDLNRNVSNNVTIKIDRFINDTNIYLCNCEYIYYIYNSFYIDIYNNKNKIILKN